MVKKIVLWVVGIVVVLGAAMAYLNYRNYSLSPRGEAALTNGDLSVSIVYCRPSVRGRQIFGTKEQGALQPHGAYWRLGANEATQIVVNKDVYFNGQPLKAGTYVLYAVPNDSGFAVYANTGIGRWGASEADHDLDVLKTDVIAETVPTPTEQYTISLLPTEGGATILFEWADRKWAIPVTRAL